MQKEIEARVASGGDETTGAVDPEYWQNLLTRLKVFKAKAFLGEMHKEMLNRRLSQLQEKQVRILAQNVSLVFFSLCLAVFST